MENSLDDIMNWKDLSLDEQIKKAEEILLELENGKKTNTLYISSAVKSSLNTNKSNKHENAQSAVKSTYKVSKDTKKGLPAKQKKVRRKSTVEEILRRLHGLDHPKYVLCKIKVANPLAIIELKTLLKNCMGISNSSTSTIVRVEHTEYLGLFKEKMILNAACANNDALKFNALTQEDLDAAIPNLLKLGLKAVELSYVHKKLGQTLLKCLGDNDMELLSKEFILSAPKLGENVKE